jgi:thiol-disulfide isomerase/thioredoxin
MTRRLWGIGLVVLVIGGCARTVGSKDEYIEIGWLDRSVLDRSEHYQFKARFDTVQVDQNLTALISNTSSNVNFLVFFGTWCGDSRREVPHFLKILDQCGIPSSRTKLYGVDRSKRSKDGLTDQYHIERVPTFIFLEGDKEIGRITERPEGTLEANILSILASGK